MSMATIDPIEDVLPDDQLGPSDREPDFKALLKRAGPHLLKLLEGMYPEGKRFGEEYCIGDVKGSPGQSLKFNLTKGVWKDFAETEQKGGDIISLNAARLGVSMSEAARDLEHRLDKMAAGSADYLSLEEPKPYTPTAPVPREAELSTEKDWNRWLGVHNLPALEAHYEYRDEAGHLLLYIIRYNKRGKQIRPVTYDGTDWVLRAYPPPRPLYGLDHLASRSDAPVLVVEGEKTANAARELLPEYVVVTWMNGANAVQQVDWSPLSGRDVKLWPDADEAGRKAMNDIGALLLKNKAGRIRIVNLPEGLRDGWDLADVIPKDLDIHTLLASASEAPPPVQPKSKTSSLDSALEEMNEKHFVAQEGGKTLVFTPKRDPHFKRTHLEASGFADIKNFYLNRKFKVEKKRVSLGACWLEYEKRRNYEGIVLAPQGAPRGYYNLWQGFSVEPEGGDWSLLRNHILEIVCGGNEAWFEYMMGWMASAVQHPERQAEVAVVLKGDKGTGKGVVARSLGHLFGQHFLHVFHSRHLTGNFNAHLRDCILLFADEAYWAGDKSGEGVLKGLITEPTLAIEAKGRDLVTVPNMIHLMIASNSEWVVPASWGERRFFVLETSDKRKGDGEYFRAIFDQLANGGYGAMLHDLQKLDLGNFNIRVVPETEALREQKTRSMDSLDEWWRGCLDAGIIMCEGTYHKDWEQPIETTAVYESYIAASKNSYGRYSSNSTALGIRFKKWFESLNKRISKKENKWPRKRRHTGKPYEGKAARSVEPSKLTFYMFPSLDKSRKAFEAYTGTPIEWSVVERSDEDAPDAEGYM